jgi:hypothetical protein
VLSTIVLSFPVDFQNPNGVERFVLDPFAYFLSRGQKKYHSISLLWRQDLSGRSQGAYLYSSTSDIASTSSFFLSSTNKAQDLLDGSEIQVEGMFVPLLQDLNKEISRNSSVNERRSLDSNSR